jgi:2-methylisocitrate lyase-like PEP mutase family enzyme
LTSNQADKAARFRKLHEGPGAFVIPNPWDGGSARILAGLGFQALATSSGAAAGVLGRRDGHITRDETLAQVRIIVEATDLPVSADLEKGFGDAPAVVAETVRLAAEAGLVGCSIEDATGNKDRPLYEFSAAVERVRVAAQAAKQLGFPFTLTARSENFADAGADVLMAPGLPDLASVAKVCRAVSKPVNFMAGIKGKSFSVAELEKAGVRRISLATSLYRAAMTGLVDAAREVKDGGTFGYLERSLATPDLARFMQE